MIEDLHRIIYATLKAALPTTDSLLCDDKHPAGHLYNPLESNSKTATAACQNTSKEEDMQDFGVHMYVTQLYYCHSHV